MSLFFANGITPSQKQLNNKETPSAYDRYIRRQNHHPLSKDSSQSNSATEENVRNRSTTGAVSQPSNQKKIDIAEKIPE
jgi:hypothetical protein